VRNCYLRKQWSKAMEAWNQAWKSAEGREEWLTPESFVQEAIPILQSNGVARVLDLGFGVGRHAILLAKAGFDVHGIDAAASGLAYAEEWAKAEGVALTLATGDMTQLPYPDGYFDAVLTWNVIYHGLAETIHQTISEIERVLKPQGYLICSFISTLNLRYGEGNEVEHHTFIIPGGGEKEHPHHYFDQSEVESYLGNFELLRYEDAIQKSANNYHWHVLGRLRA
jgi:tellurite methyltransferase